MKQPRAIDRGQPTVYFARLARARETWELFAGSQAAPHGAPALVRLGAKRGSEADLRAWAEAHGIALVDLDKLRGAARAARESAEGAAARDLGLTEGESE